MRSNVIKKAGRLALATRIRLLAEKMLQDGSEIYKSLNLDFEPRFFAVFYLLKDNPSLSVTEIANHIGISQPAVTQILNGMLKKNLVRIVKDKVDTRKKLIMISKKGEAMLPQLLPLWKDFESGIGEMFDSMGINILEILDKVESALDEKSVYERVIGKVKKRLRENVKIEKYKPEYKIHFKNLNLEWLNKFFEVEPVDKKVLNNPETEVINGGGMIFFALIDGEVVGTCALIKTNNHFELSKMAVTEKARGRQAGYALCEAAVNYAKEKNADMIFLSTSHKLKSAINLYSKFGFAPLEISEADKKYKRDTFKMILPLKS
ncbi:MAG: bifunctional helix-turn-helix transcriptional regulator/GNAT family N-acetyltransferase [Ignavibacteria bacterium]|nr:bifunctional helix-turn-helix transcriptional regulator/GNAT family N-acetyltransferase [Ignavibacteria bacterium]